MYLRVVLFLDCVSGSGFLNFGVEVVAQFKLVLLERFKVVLLFLTSTKCPSLNCNEKLKAMKLINRGNKYKVPSSQD